MSKSSTLENAVTDTSRVLLVSDLDGTMVGNDEYTHEFRKFWESDARHKDSKLVYSTGRSFESFLGLITSKRDILINMATELKYVLGPFFVFFYFEWHFKILSL